MSINNDNYFEHLHIHYSNQIMYIKIANTTQGRNTEILNYQRNIQILIDTKTHVEIVIIVMNYVVTIN